MLAPLVGLDGKSLHDRLALPPVLARAERAVAVAAPAESAGAPEAVQIQLSEQARLALGEQGGRLSPEPAQAFASALQQGLVGLGQETKKVFTLLGMSAVSASQAAATVSLAIREATGSPAFQGQVLSFVGSWRDNGEGFPSYRASLIVEQAGLAWDPAAREFVVTMKRLALSVALDGGAVVVPRGVPAPPVTGTRMSPVIQIDAAAPISLAAMARAVRS